MTPVFCQRFDDPFATPTRAVRRQRPRNALAPRDGRPVPAWLDRSGPRLHVVRREEVFPDPEVLPTFNSNAIEMNLHPIPGLSRRFLYFNDDVFLGRPVPTEDFFLPGGGQRFVMLEDRPWTMLRAFAGILWRRPTFFCVNDDLGEASPRHPLLLALRAFLLLRFPWRGPAERPLPS